MFNPVQNGVAILEWGSLPFFFGRAKKTRTRINELSLSPSPGLRSFFFIFLFSVAVGFIKGVSK